MTLTYYFIMNSSPIFMLTKDDLYTIDRKSCSHANLLSSESECLLKKGDWRWKRELSL